MYGIPAGQLDTRVTFKRRAFVSVRDRGEFAPILTVWAQYTRANGREQMQAGQEVGFEAATIRIRDSAVARTITGADRVVIAGRDHRITSVSMPMRTGMIEIAVTTDLAET